MAQGSVPCNRGPEQHFFVATYQESWSATTWDTLRIYSMHLVTAGGSGAAARTALAPLERVKVHRSCVRPSIWYMIRAADRFCLHADPAAGGGCQSPAIHAEIWIHAKCSAQHPSQGGLCGEKVLSVLQQLKPVHMCSVFLSYLAYRRHFTEATVQMYSVCCLILC